MITRTFLLGTLLFWLLPPILQSQEKVEQKGRAYRVRIPLPLTASTEESTRRQLADLAAIPFVGARPAVILHFEMDSRSGTEDARSEMGRRTSFTHALGIARWLTSNEGNRVRSIAYLPRSIEGHAVLVALACEEIAMASDATLGEAGVDEPTIDATIAQAYRDIALRRQNLPTAAVEALLDSSSELFAVTLRDETTKSVLGPERLKLKGNGEILSEDQILYSGEPHRLPGSTLRKLGWISYLIEDPATLYDTLQLASLPVDLLEDAGPWQAALFEVHGNITTRSVNQLFRAMDVAAQKNANLLIFDFDSAGGSIEESLRLAQRIASFDRKKIRTVGYLSGIARGDAAIIALACDTLFVSESSRLGGSGEASIEPTDVERLLPTLRDLAQQTGKGIGQFEAVLCPDLPVFLFSSANGVRQWSSATAIRNDPLGNWVQGEQLQIGDGIEGERLVKLGWARDLRAHRDLIATDFRLDQLPEVTRTNPVEEFVQRLADQEWLPPLLISIGFMALVIEMTTPGATFPGFVAALCFLLLFWIRVLNGTVEWLEVLLFFGGVLALAMELFVLPGFGVFGFGGILMLIAAIILASQTFLWPSNRYQMNEMAWNMSQAAGAILGVCVGLFLIRNQLENLPFFRWLALKPVAAEEAERLSEREAVAHFDYLKGKTGIAMTHCVPSGKAKIGDQVVNVLSDGPMIEEGASVRILEVRGNTIVVQEIT